MNQFEENLLDCWRENCKRQREITDKLQALKWYQIFKSAELLGELKENNKSHNVLFQKLCDSGTFNK